MNEVNHLQITKPLSLEEFFDSSTEEIVIVFKSYVIVGMSGYYDFNWKMFRDLKEFQEYIGLDDDIFESYYERPSILKQLKEQDPQIINFLQCDI